MLATSVFLIAVVYLLRGEDYLLASLVWLCYGAVMGRVELYISPMCVAPYYIVWFPFLTPYIYCLIVVVW